MVEIGLKLGILSINCLSRFRYEKETSFAAIVTLLAWTTKDTLLARLK